jgi:hypothetical protein
VARTSPLWSYTAEIIHPDPASMKVLLTR